MPGDRGHRGICALLLLTWFVIGLMVVPFRIAEQTSHTAAALSRIAESIGETVKYDRSVLNASEGRFPRVITVSVAGCSRRQCSPQRRGVQAQLLPFSDRPDHRP